MHPNLTFGPLLTPQGRNLASRSTNPTMPYTGQDFAVQSTDWNASILVAGPYSEAGKITGDRNGNVTVWQGEEQVDGLVPALTLAHIVNIPPNEIAPGTYTFHVFINARWVAGTSVESNSFNTYTFDGGIGLGF
ncbi:hypothetical protein NKI39_22110 [Mesorhizobium sp. M0664]|uniref:hypothetical protein n=1 Tax=Mesorhizobium sp. M0664 TaxID=2956982 RepID=UPI00333DD221